jgi:hypothetical protein
MNVNWVHLYRGAPAVRSWSRYQLTDPRWTLCGIDYGTERVRVRHATEDPRQVTCTYCNQLLQPASYDRPPASKSK